MKKNILLFLSIFSISACTNMKVTTHIPYKKTSSIQKIALFEVLIGKPIQAVLPLIDAAAFNSKMNKVADEIMDIQQQKVTIYRETIASNMRTKLDCEVIYGTELQNSPNFQHLKETLSNPLGLQTSNDNYPIVQMADGEFNAFPFEKGKVDAYFSSTAFYGNIITTLCEELNVDAIAISSTQLNTLGVTSFGIGANARLNTTLYIFDKNGNTIGHGSANSQIINIKGKDIADYNMILDEFNIIISPLTEQLVNPIKK